jgi:hypothetical protein
VVPVRPAAAERVVDRNDRTSRTQSGLRHLHINSRATPDDSDVAPARHGDQEDATASEAADRKQDE